VCALYASGAWSQSTVIVATAHRRGFSDGSAGAGGVLAMLRGPLVPRRYAIATMTLVAARVHLEVFA
jgi:hypothetical protein